MHISCLLMQIVIIKCYRYRVIRLTVIMMCSRHNFCLSNHQWLQYKHCCVIYYLIATGSMTTFNKNILLALCSTPDLDLPLPPPPQCSYHPLAKKTWNISYYITVMHSSYSPNLPKSFVRCSLIRIKFQTVYLDQLAPWFCWWWFKTAKKEIVVNQIMVAYSNITKQVATNQQWCSNTVYVT